MVTAVVLLLCTLAASCGSSATTQPGRDRTASTSVPVMVDRGTARPGLALARTASTAYRALIDTDSAAFAAAVGRLQADLAGADVSAARSDELAAQSAFDGFRQLGAGNTVIASALDEQATDVGPGETFAGLHAVERDLWSTVPGDPVADAMASTEGLVAQAPVVRYLLARQTLAPATIAATAVDELGWVDDVAILEEAEPASHLDAVDIAATTSAAQAAFSTVQPLAQLVSPALTASVASHFASLAAQVAALGPPGLRPDHTLPIGTRRALAQQVTGTAGLLASLSALLVPYGTSPTAS